MAEGVGHKAPSPARVRVLNSLMGLLLADTSQAMDDLAGDLVAEAGAGEALPAANVAERVQATLDKLADSHAHAAYLGRQKAGNDHAFGDDDVSLGDLAALEQADFMERFVRDVQTGRYTREDGTVNEAAIARRAQMYSDRVRGTANLAWRMSLAPGTVVYWRLGEVEDHCTDCPGYEASSPYPVESLPTVPGECETQCLTNCGCYLETADGLESFRREG